jgi:hypothetical protein
VLARHSKTRAVGDHNLETQYLGYSTTAFYFYNLCDCANPKAAAADTHNRFKCASAGGSSPIPSQYLQRSSVAGTCDSYGDTLLAVDAALTEQNIPYVRCRMFGWKPGWLSRYSEGVHACHTARVVGSRSQLLTFPAPPHGMMLLTTTHRYKHMLLDSWWYGEGWHGGAALWEDVPACTNVSFPNGLHDFWEKIGTDKTIWVHNGLWSAKSPYREHYEFSSATGPPQGKDPFVGPIWLLCACASAWCRCRCILCMLSSDPPPPLPLHPPTGRALWDHLFSANHNGWGLGTIKQDHIGQQMGAGGKEGYSNVSVFDSWFDGMGEAAAANDVGVLYCCAPPSVHMKGVTVPAAYGVRASPDYVWAPSNGAPLPSLSLQCS